MNRIQSLLSLALHYAERSPREQRMAALVVWGRRVISFGINSFKTHPKQKEGKSPFRSTHAELSAVAGLPLVLLVDSTVVVARLTKGGCIGLAKPCKNCEEMLRSLGVTKVFFTTGYDGNILYEEMKLRNR